MEKQLGFALIEVLIVLLIFSMGAFSLFSHQWQLLKSYQTTQQLLLAYQLLDNASEAALSNTTLPASYYHLPAIKHLYPALSVTKVAGKHVQVHLRFSYQAQKKNVTKVLKRVL